MATQQILKAVRCRKCWVYKSKHGHAGSKARPRTKTYWIWSAMIQRVTNANHAYKSYGGRGIEICDRWLRFENFLADMGQCPKGLTIERRNTNGNYEPGNCEWATRERQQQNRRVNRFTPAQILEIRHRYSKGERQYLLAREFGVRNTFICSIVNKRIWKTLPGIGNDEIDTESRITKGRASGETHGFAKLTQRDVDGARLLSSAGATQRFIATRYGVAPSTIGRALRGRTWRESEGERRDLEEFRAAMLRNSFTLLSNTQN